MQQTTQVSMNDHARRQTAESNYSHYESGPTTSIEEDFDALCSLVETNLDKKVILSDDEDGQVIKVTLPGEGFFSAVTQAKEGMEFVCKFAAREPGEYPYFSFCAVDGPKVPAAESDVILYSHSKLAKKNEQSTDADWEIVSNNAKRNTDEEPPHPVTMMRNHYDYLGGTKTKYTDEQFAESIRYWFGGGPVAPFVMLDC